MAPVRLDKCHRCGCPEEAHFDANGRPGPCGGDLGPDCPCNCRRYRDGGEDLSRINRLLHNLIDRAATSSRVVDIVASEGAWRDEPRLHEPTSLEPQTETLITEYTGEAMERILGSVAVPPELFRGEKQGEVSYGPFHESSAGWLSAPARDVVDAGVVSHDVVGGTSPGPATGPPE